VLPNDPLLADDHPPAGHRPPADRAAARKVLGRPRFGFVGRRPDRKPSPRPL
jgi:hypothetical protein